MAQLLSKKSLLVLLLLCTALLQAQEEDITPDFKDYKTEGEFYKFHKSAKAVGAWQINKLKAGALVVRLRTNKTLIDGLLAQGNEKMARQKMAETYLINKNTMMAYIHNFNFCKLYFIYSSGSDSLMKGARSGIFLDTNLRVNAQIEMTESFYLISERDYAYNSSIGFVPEDSALTVKESGNPIREMGAVIKNRYGHQLKSPFPYYVKDRTYADYPIPFYVAELKDEKRFVWVSDDEEASKTSFIAKHPGAKDGFVVKIKKQHLYKQISGYISEMNETFNSYYQSSPMPEVQKLNVKVRSYLY